MEGFGECTSQELSKLLVWLLVVGYQLRVLEVRLDLEATMLVSSMDEVGSFAASSMPHKACGSLSDLVRLCDMYAPVMPQANWSRS